MAAKDKKKAFIKVGEVISYRPTVAAIGDEEILDKVVSFANSKIRTTSITRNDLITKSLELMMKSEEGSLEEKLDIVGISISDILELFNSKMSVSFEKQNENARSIKKIEAADKKNNSAASLITSIPDQGIRK